MDINKLNGIVQSIARKTGVPHQSIYDMYFFERFLNRLSLSKYRTNFVIKGGFLLENIVGIKARATMDIDLKTVGITLSDEEIVAVFTEIALIYGGDGIEYSVLGVSDIAAELKYGGKTVKIQARLKNLKKIFSVDVAQGDIVTPYPCRYMYKSSVDGSTFELLAYTNETIIAEKFETLIAKGMGNSRAKDLFDIHILLKQNIDYDRLNAALINTFYVRGTKFNVTDIRRKLNDIYNSGYRKEMFEGYAKKHSFANGVSFYYDGKSILLVTHGGVITVIMCLVNGWQYSNKLKIVPPPATKIDI